jgi:hypothetical protein
MGALVLIVLVLFAVAGLVARRGPRRRWLALVPGVPAVIGLLASIASFVVAATGDTGDMDPAGVVMLGLVYLGAAAGLALLARRLAFRR